MNAKQWACAALALLPLAAGGHAQAGDKSIKVGVMADMSGFAADIGGQGAVLAARLASAEVGGKAAGKPIEIVGADMQNKPDVAAEIARRWYDKEDVDVIVDLPVSPVALAVQEVARDRKKVTLVTAAATTDLTNKNCSPYAVHWADDTYALAVGGPKAIVESGGKTWFFITADFAFGHAMEKAATEVINGAGGKVLGGVRHPTNTNDFASFLVAAQGSKANVVGLANVGTDTINAIKQAGEFGLTQSGQRMLGFITFITDVHTLGLQTAQGLMVTENYYWDENDATRAFAKKFMAEHKKMPSKEQASTYAALVHYFRAVDAAGTDEAGAVVAKMKEMPIDNFGRKGTIRKDGRALYDISLYQVKSPAESKYDWDYYKKVRDIPQAEAFMPLEKSTCAFVRS